MFRTKSGREISYYGREHSQEIRRKRYGTCKKRVPGKVCVSKAFWEKEAQWSERTGGFINKE